MEYLLGIDLGTTNCSVTAIDENGKTFVIKNRDGEYLTPSAVYFNEVPNSYTIGKKAKEKASTNPDRLVMLVKREMGKKADEVCPDIFTKKPKPYRFWGKNFSPEEISSKILRQLKEDAEKELGTKIKKAVITCPGYFGQNEKEATRLAGELADFEVMEVITEPVAAALSYGSSCNKDSEKIFVFDLGGGTFDVTVVNLYSKENKGKTVEIECLDGNSRLGGADWDWLLISYMVKAFKLQYDGIDIYKEHTEEASRTLGDLKLKVEAAKKELSASGVDKTEISMSYEGKTLCKEITRSDFIEITRQPTDRCMDYCRNLLVTHNLDWSDIDTILMVGSMSNCFSVQQALRNLCGRDVDLGTIINRKTCVSEGAAIKAYYNICEKNGKTAVVQTLNEKPAYDKVDSSKKDDTSVKLLEEIEDLEKNGKRLFTVIDSARSAIPASISLKGHKGDKNFAKKLLKKDEPYPIERSMDVPLGSDGMNEVNLVVLEGESEDPFECTELGRAVLPLEGSHSKVDKVRVTFSIDISGIIQIAGIDLKTNKSVKAEIKKNNSMSDFEKQAIIDQIEEDVFTF